MDWRRRLARWRGRPSAGVWVAVLVVVGLAVLAGCVYVLPQMLVPHRSAASLAAVADAAKRLELEDAGLEQRNDVRTTLLQGLAGAVVAVGLSLTWRQIRVNQEGQITERFNKAIDKAIDHLGSDKLDLRLGGIYALQRIAKNSSADRDTIAEILTAFVRQRSPWPPSQPGQYRDDFPVNRQPQLRTRAADIQAVLTVLGQGGFTREGAMALDLAAVDLRRALLPRARLDGANLIDARLQGAILIDAQLQGTYLVDARLQGASLNNAQLDDASLIGAWLQGAILEEAHLDDADLRNAHLEGAYLRRAHLEARTSPRRGSMAQTSATPSSTARTCAAPGSIAPTYVSPSSTAQFVMYIPLGQMDSIYLRRGSQSGENYQTCRSMRNHMKHPIFQIGNHRPDLSKLTFSSVLRPRCERLSSGSRQFTFPYGPPQVERHEALKDVLITQRIGPPVGGIDRLVQPCMRPRQPGRRLVVEVG